MDSLVESETGTAVHLRIALAGIRCSVLELRVARENENKRRKRSDEPKPNTSQHLQRPRKFRLYSLLPTPRLQSSSFWGYLI